MVVLNLERLVHVPVVKDTKDVLAWTIDTSAEQEVGEAKAKVFLGQVVVSALG